MNYSSAIDFESLLAMIFRIKSNKERFCTIEEAFIPTLKQSLSIPKEIIYHYPSKLEIYSSENEGAWISYQLFYAKLSTDYKKVLKIMLATPPTLFHLLPCSLAAVEQ